MARRVRAHSMRGDLCPHSGNKSPRVGSAVIAAVYAAVAHGWRRYGCKRLHKWPHAPRLTQTTMAANVCKTLALGSELATDAAALLDGYGRMLLLRYFEEAMQRL